MLPTKAWCLDQQRRHASLGPCQNYRLSGTTRTSWIWICIPQAALCSSRKCWNLRDIGVYMRPFVWVAQAAPRCHHGEGGRTSHLLLSWCFMPCVIKPRCCVTTIGWSWGWSESATDGYLQIFLPLSPCPFPFSPSALPTAPSLVVLVSSGSLKSSDRALSSASTLFSKS